MQVQAHNKKV